MEEYIHNYPDFRGDMPLEEEQMEKVLEYLGQDNVEVYCVLPMTIMRWRRISLTR